MSGELALEASRACAEKGVYAYIKHFALNDQEDHRSHVATFSNEQAIREIYLKPFQTCIEERGTTPIKVQEYDAASQSYTEKTVEIPAVMAVHVLLQPHRLYLGRGQLQPAHRGAAQRVGL